MIKMFLLPHRLWMPLLIILFLLRHVSITHLCTEKPTFVLSFSYMCDIIWPSAPLKSCYLARNLKEVARAWNRPIGDANKHKTIRIRSSKNYSKEQFIHNLNETDWTDVLNSVDADLASMAWVSRLYKSSFCIRP